MFSKPMLLILTGPKGAGKTWLSEQLVKRLRATELAFADPLKQALIEMYGRAEYFHDPKLKEQKHPHSSLSGRKLMQALGDHIRSQDPNAFVSAAQRRFMALLRYDNPGIDVAQQEMVVLPQARTPQPNSLYVLSDARYENEVKAFWGGQSYQTVCVEVYNPKLPENTDPHSSEAGLASGFANVKVENVLGTPIAYYTLLGALSMLDVKFKTTLDNAMGHIGQPRTV